MTSPISAGPVASGSSAPAWRQFSFFDVSEVKDVHDLDSSPEIFKAAPELSCIASSSAGLLVADIHGSMHLLNRDFESTMSWVAQTGGRVTHMVERKGVLITLGEEDSVRSPVLKIWDLQSKDKKTHGPVLLRSTRVQLSNRPHPVSALAVSSNLSHLAIGLADGSVLLYRHLDQSLASAGSLTALPKPRTVHENAAEPITGLGFREPFAVPSSAVINGNSPHQVEDTHPQLGLFVVTTNRVLLYPASGRSGAQPTVVDEVGCGLGCAKMDWRKRDMIVARDEAIYVCGADGRGACYAYEGVKSYITTHQNYLVIVSPPFQAKASSASATVRNFVAKTPNAGENEISKVSVFDPENKLVAYTGTFQHGVRDVVSAWGKIYVLSNNGTLSCLEEKPTSTKLNMLYSKSLYGLALNLAKTQELEDSSVADIHRQYGDHQYSKGDYDGAMQQYVQTIGHLQPSYVIRKFLDAQRIHNLVTYLQELHLRGLANADHTTLLLNTYTKLKDVSRLDAFIKTESKRGGDLELPFDLETAIRVCRQAGFYEHAAYLAKKYARHEDYLRIKIEDVGDYADALKYVRMLGMEAAEANLARYGRAMLANLPQETTELLIDLCTSLDGDAESDDDSMTVAKSGATSPTAGTPAPGGPSYLSYLALRGSNAPATASSDTATVAAQSIKTVKARAATAGDSSPGHDISRTSTPPPTSTSTSAFTQPPALPLPPSAPPVKKPKRLSPRLYFAHFVDHMEQFVVFLETVALRRWGQSVDPTAGAPPRLDESQEDDKADQEAVWNTLLELYLTLVNDKALRVLESETIPYEPTHALILCSVHSHTEGLVLLWERLGMHEDVIRFYIDRGDASSIMMCLRRYGEQNPGLYPLVLRFLTSQAGHEEDVKEVLDHIDEQNIMPPLAVIQVLSRNGVTSVGLVREWLVGRIRDARKEIKADQEWTESYRMETAAKLKQVADLSDTEHPKVFHVSRCSNCGGQLDLPSVHFMCNHSYHQRCLLDQESECPNCAREYSVIREIRRNNEQLADQHDVFLSEVQENGFKAVADAFSRGVLNSSRIENPPTTISV